MIRILKKIGTDGKHIRIIAHLYWHQKATIRSGCDISDFTSIKRGVRQGCILSPYLFNIYTEFIFRKTSNFPGLNIGGRHSLCRRHVVVVNKEEEAATAVVIIVRVQAEVVVATAAVVEAGTTAVVKAIDVVLS
ncbi:LINE-1 reverse transcriptase [Elysia marginata]|uniref:LINE-1 reverse transcriptase n=1 Tax=Elysia marginata TaxID=1093978 RepID=A0AAV4H657_9GAST|nr:LINE-1 reverse transcriptase [Elysia marginata]